MATFVSDTQASILERTGVDCRPIVRVVSAI